MSFPIVNMARVADKYTCAGAGVHALEEAHSALGNARNALGTASGDSDSARVHLETAYTRLVQGAHFYETWPRIPAQINSVAAQVAHALIDARDLPRAKLDTLIVRATDALERATHNNGSLEIALFSKPQNHAYAACQHLEEVDRISVDTTFDAGSAVARAAREGAAADITVPDAYGNARRFAAELARDESLRAVGREVRNGQAQVFRPIANDFFTTLRATMNGPLEEAPRFGGVPGVLTPAGATLDTFAQRVALTDTSMVERAQKYVAARKPSDMSDPVFDIQVNVGAYGERLALALVEAGRITSAASLASLHDLPTRALAGQASELLTESTYRGTKLEQTLLEGANSFPVAFGHLTYAKVGNLSAEQLLDTIVESNVVTALGHGPLAMIGQLNLHHVAVKEPLKQLANGRVARSEQWMAVDRQYRDAAGQHGTEGPATMAGCPVARELSGLAREYVGVVKRLLADPSFHPPA